MKKVFQTRIEKGTGDCMQAVVASLLELELNDVPDFIKAPNNSWYTLFFKFLKDNGYEMLGTLYNLEDSRLRGEFHPTYLDHYNRIISNNNFVNRLEELKMYNGINGCFFAGVYSPKFCNLKDEHPATHAVIIDNNFNILHDPNKEYENLKEYPYSKELGYNGIIDVYLIEKQYGN